MECGKVLQCNFPAFLFFLLFFFFILATNPNSIVEGEIAKKASLENWHSRNEQQQTFGTGCS